MRHVVIFKVKFNLVMEYVVGSVAALVSGNVTPSRPKHLKRALTPTKHQPSPNVTPKSELVDRSIFLSPTLQKKKAIAKKSPKRIFENQNLDVTEEDSILVSPKADKVKKQLETELDANTSVNSSLLSPESPKDSSEMKKSPKKLKVMNAAAHVYENTSPKNCKRKLNEEPVTKNVESNDASPNKKKKQERKTLSQDAANANQQNGAQIPKKYKKQQQQETTKPNQDKKIKPQNQVQNSQAKQKPGQQNKNKAEKSEVQSPKKQNHVQNSQGKQKQKPAQQNKNKPGQSAEAQSPKKQNQVQKTQAKQNQKAVQQNKNNPVEKIVEAQSPKKQNKKKNRKNKKNHNESVPKPEPKVEAESESDEDDDDADENDDSIDPNTSSNIDSDSEDDSDDEVESDSDEDDDDEEDDDEENDDTVNPNAITNEDSDSEHDSDDEIESENDEANKQALQPEESSDDEEEEELKDTKKNTKKPEKKGKGPKVELREEQKTEALEEEIKRTVFVGNVPFSKKCKKEIKKIFNEYGTIETIRIRTVPVKDATVTPKLAIIKNELHPERSTVNVYVKFADKASVEKALKANNTVLNGNHLRVHRTGTTGAVHDPKLSVFVGNIPFALEDEGLRAKFEKCGAIESVRIIRDRKTHAGKGFGYVNFESKDGVELALAMSEEDLTIKNRILRVKRCTHTEKKNKDKLPKKFVGNFQSNNKVQGDDGKKNNGAFRRIEMKRKLEARADGPASKRANVNQPRDKKQRNEFVGMTAEKKKKRKFDKGQKKKKVLGEILAKK